MWEYLKSIYSGRNVFVTGHTGFKGAWITETLHLLGANVTAYSLAPYYDNNLYELLHLVQKTDSTIGDIRNYDLLSKKMSESNPDFVFHLAAQPLVKVSYDDPIDTYGSNVMGTVNVLEAMRHIDTKITGVMITTDKVYENKEIGDPFTEADKLGGHDPYSSSKACCEIVIDSYVKSYFPIDKIDSHHKAIASCRAGNVIGGGDWATYRLVPDIINALVKDEAIDIRNPKAIRPWQHVLESVFAYLLLGAKASENPQKYAQAYNIGPEESDILKVVEVVDKAIEIWGSGKYNLAENPNAVHEAGILKLDCTKLKTVLGWRPVFNVDDAVRKTIEWYKVNADDPAKSEAKTDEQIMEYANAFQLIEA